jgi:hypothetical protein
MLFGAFCAVKLTMWPVVLIWSIILPISGVYNAMTAALKENQSGRSSLLAL